MNLQVAAVRAHLLAMYSLYTQHEGEFMDECYGTLAQCIQYLCKLKEEGRSGDAYQIVCNDKVVIEGE